MNALADLRESFFKTKIATLMAKPTVIHILNKPTSRSSIPSTVSPPPPPKINEMAKIELSSKRKEM